MPQRSLVAMVALREWAPDWLGSVQAALEAGRVDLPPVEVRRQEGTLAFHWGGEADRFGRRRADSVDRPRGPLQVGMVLAEAVARGAAPARPSPPDRIASRLQ